jgi:hypothetical protein
MSSPIDTKIKARVDEFVQELSVLIQAAALDAVQQAIAGAGALTTRGGARRGRPARATKARANAQPAAAAKAGGKGRKKAGKRAAKKAAGRKGKRGRPATALDPAMAKKVVDALAQSKDGMAISEIAGAVGAAKEAVSGTVSQLVAEKKIRKTGERRGTKYHAR